jgi:hypothetical protein
MPQLQLRKARDDFDEAIASRYPLRSGFAGTAGKMMSQHSQQI